MADFRTLIITEVNPAKRIIQGRDEFGQNLVITSYFLHHVLTIPAVGERWLVEKQGNQWLLDRKFDIEDKMLSLNEGDTHVEAKNNLLLTAPRVIINGTEFNHESKINIFSQSHHDNRRSLIGSASNVAFRSSETVTLNSIYDVETDQVDIWADIKNNLNIYPLELENNWKNLSSALWQFAQFYKDINDVLHVEGTISHATAGQTGTIATLPFGFIPDQCYRFICDADVGLAVVDINGLNNPGFKGVISLNTYKASGTAAYVSLNLICSLRASKLGGFEASVPQVAVDFKVTGA